MKLRSAMNSVMAAIRQMAVAMIETRSPRLSSCAVLFIAAVSSNGSAEAVCVTCAPTVKTVRCEIEKSDVIENLPFGQRLLERACVKAIKATEGSSKCRAEKDALCSSALTKKFSLKAAKQILIDGRDAAAERPTIVSSNSSGTRPKSESPPPSGNPLSQAWAHFLAIFARH
jgi:hypothetical protein